MLPELSIEQKVMILGLMAFAVIGCCAAFFGRGIDKEANVQAEPAGTLTEKGVTAEPEYSIVHISGAVKREGVYKIKKGERVYNLIVLAGGLENGADIDSVNFATVLSDGQKVGIPYKLSMTAATGITPNKKASKKEYSILDLNSATASELVSLPGIGDSTAKKIIELRERKGRFYDLSELKEIPGMSDKKIAKLSPYLRVD